MNILNLILVDHMEVNNVELDRDQLLLKVYQLYETKDNLLAQLKCGTEQY